MTDPIKHPDAISAIHAVAAELSQTGISKDRENTHFRFKFRGIDDVYCALSPLLAKHGLVILHNVVQRVVTQLEKGGVNVALEVCYTFHVAGVDDSDVIAPSGTVTSSRKTAHATIWAEATDTADKATSKAMSMAYKTMAFQVFCIPTEGQDDADYHSPEPSKPKAAKKDVLADLPSTTIALLPIPPSFGTPEHAVAWLPNCKTAERVREWMNRVAKEFAGDTDKELIKQGFEKFKRGEV